MNMSIFENIFSEKYTVKTEIEDNEDSEEKSEETPKEDLEFISFENSIQILSISFSFHLPNFDFSESKLTTQNFQIPTPPPDFVA